MPPIKRKSKAKKPKTEKSKAKNSIRAQKKEIDAKIMRVVRKKCNLREQINDLRSQITGLEAKISTLDSEQEGCEYKLVLLKRRCKHKYKLLEHAHMLGTEICTECGDCKEPYLDPNVLPSN